MIAHRHVFLANFYDRSFSYFMTEDYLKSVAFNRKKMLPIFYHARKSLGKKDVFLKGDVLITSGEKYTTGNLTTLPGDLHPKCLSRNRTMTRLYLVDL